MEYAAGHIRSVELLDQAVPAWSDTMDNRFETYLAGDGEQALRMQNVNETDESSRLSLESSRDCRYAGSLGLTFVFMLLDADDIVILLTVKYLMRVALITTESTCSKLIGSWDDWLLVDAKRYRIGGLSSRSRSCVSLVSLLKE